jgi:hypothetical protein
MTIYSDSQGNHYLGDCIYANHNLAYPALNYLQSHPITSFVGELTDLFTAAGIDSRDIISQSTLTDLFYSRIAASNRMRLFCFGLANDPDDLDDRFAYFLTENINQSSYPTLILCNSNGYSVNTDIYNDTNVILFLGSNGGVTDGNPLGSSTNTIDFKDPDIDLVSPVYCVGGADSGSLSLFFYQMRYDTGFIYTVFMHVGSLTNINTENNYYNQSYTSSIVMGSSRMGLNIVTDPENANGTYGTGTTGLMYFANRVFSTGKMVLQSGKAQYSIVCSDSQIPISQWITDLYAFDNDSTLEFPAMGRCRNLLLAQGVYTIGKPIRIDGSVFPDNGFNCWLPVGAYANKTLLMRCYTSSLF